MLPAKEPASATLSTFVLRFGFCISPNCCCGRVIDVNTIRHERLAFVQVIHPKIVLSEIALFWAFIPTQD